MAPQKGARASAMELAFEDTSTITKQKLAVQAQMSARGRRNGAAAAANGHSLKDLASASETVSQAAGPTPAAPVGIDWRKEDIALLHRYRRAYSLPCPSAFQNPMANCILQSGIGMQSPTMARAKNKRRIRREELAMIVRRNFKEAPVVENECVVTLMYKVQMKDKSFRLKFPAKSTR
ncbi:hypothetical protein E2P81_ATG03125 [Venturia nashicola]|uniref:Histone deacetylase complex subunit SAP30 Sin3 binding domain-containing protein n=1 Tax=Venturia nashicola TaxID=86259 RepID=A0A4Z1PJJ7_9PEZI|nr:hypothetical protein E6O75_ATG03196 [Venturia nashicola]TLD36236.1 hypothetical protein E2P81_ATG03125 [Venturia nashicola]